jgi:hypothetical protein
MKVVIFVETKEGILFKCDTFWSKSDEPKHAKVYSNNNLSDLKGWLQTILPSNVYTDMIEYARNKYDGAKLGYFIPDESLYRNQFCLKEDVLIKDLGKPIYLWTVKMNDVSEWVVKEVHEPKDGRSTTDFYTSSMGEFIDYIQTQRDETINNVLNKKDSDKF